MIVNRIIIIGLGSIGQRHLALARSHFPEACIKVLTQYAENDGEQHANGYLKSLDEVADFNPQLAVVANPAPFHLNIGIKMAEIGAHTLIEKPLSDKIEDVDQLINAFDQLDVNLLVGYNLRFNQSLRHFRDLYNEGIIGRLYSIRAEVGQYLPDWRKNSKYQNSVSANKSLGGGVLLELSHEFDYLNWMFGRPLWVSANVGKVSNLEIDVEDQAMLHMGFRPNQSASNVSASLNLDFVRRDTTRTCTLIGDRGSLKWDCITGVVQRFDIEQNKWLETFSQSECGAISYLNEWSHLIDCIHGKDRPLISGQDGKNVLSIIEACWKSASSGQRQDVNYGD